METLVSVVLVHVECAGCRAIFGLTKNYVDVARQDGRHFHCPYCQCYLSWANSSENDRLKRQVAQLQTTLDQRGAQINDLRVEKNRERMSRLALKGVITRTKKRLGAGVCPCCTRTFSNVAEHMRSKHPEMVPSTSVAQ